VATAPVTETTTVQVQPAPAAAPSSAPVNAAAPAPAAPAAPVAPVDPNAPKDPNAAVAPADANAPVTNPSGTTTDPAAQDPNAPVDPNAPKDPNAPADPNAPKDPAVLSEADLAAYKNPDGTMKTGPDGKPLDPKTQNPDGTPKLGPDGKPLVPAAAAGDKNADGTPKLGPDGKPLDPNATDPTQQKRNDMDVMTHLTQRSNRVFLSANNKAKELNATEMDSEHLLHGLLTDPEIYKLLVGMKIQPQMIDQELDKVYKKSDKAPTTPVQVSPRVKRILDSSLVIARKLGYEFISPEHLLVASYDEGEGIAAQTLKKVNVNKEELNKKILGKKEGLDEKDSSGKMQKSALAQFTIDLTAKAEQGKLDPCVGRSDVIERVTHILSRRLKNNPVLTGEPGVGKTAVVEGLAQQIVNKQVPEQLLGKRILQLDLMSVIAGASHRGEFEERMKNLVSEVQEGKGSIILFIDEIHTIVGAGGGGEGSLDASNFIKPALSRGELQMIGATTITEYKRIEKDAALERRFQPVLVPEPTEEQAIKMLKSLRDKFEGFHRVKIPDDAIEQAVKLSKRYIGDRFLPDKAVDLIDESASAVRLPLMSLPEEIKNVEERVAQIKQEKDEADKRGDRVKVRILNSKLDDINADLNAKKDEYNVKKAQTTTVVTLDIIKDIISKKTGIPVNKLTGTEKDKLSKLEEIMHQRLIGQERPVKSVSEAVRRGRAGLKSNARPIGSFVFLGPSGVGKTELAKTLADILFGQEEAMIRFDMTEYMEKHEVAKLLGPPPGYVGYEEGGKLTEAVRQRQYAVVLFDEVEKAHPDIFNILLQILDDGRLTDNKGRTISFKNTVVICTSNIGTKLIQEELLKQNKGQVEEPPVVSTYTFSPRGREILTIGTKYFERDGSKAPSLETKPEEKKDPNVKDTQGQNKDAKKPEEKKDDQKKGWNEGILFDYFAGQKIEKMQPVAAPAEDGVAPAPAPAPQANAETDDAQFPVMGYDTHAISSKGVETISRDSLLFFKNSTTAKIWNVQTLIDYFKDGVVINALPDAPDEQLPTARLKTHSFSPDEKEVVTFRDRFWRRKEGANDWETGYLKDYFVDQTIKEGSFPNTHWDIHTFSPTGKEVIVVGETIWSREQNATEWKQQTLKEYFGADFPLDKEIDEKNKIETESEAKKYDVIKEKVMNELLKFFRPELVNRFDEVIVFEPLKFIHMIAIVKLQLKALTKLLEEQNLGFQATDSAVKEIVRGGFDPVFGARPLRRAIQRMVENPISEMIIAEKVHSGDFIYVDFDGEKLVFDIERTELVTDGTKEPKNFTPLDVRAFVAKFFAADKDAIMKDLTAKWPEYGEEPKKDGEATGASIGGEANDPAKDGAAKDGSPAAGDDASKVGESADGKDKKPEVHDAVIDGAKEAAEGTAPAAEGAKPAAPGEQSQGGQPAAPAPASKEEAELQNMLQNLSMEAAANPDPGAPTGSVTNGVPNGSTNGTMQMNGKPPGNPQGSMPQALSA
jgi:ATP-dependent Clp protease ATP-binding subunit ClpC